jgi:hypothetical protein
MVAACQPGRVVVVAVPAVFVAPEQVARIGGRFVAPLLGYSKRRNRRVSTLGGGDSMKKTMVGLLLGAALFALWIVGDATVENEADPCTSAVSVLPGPLSPDVDRDVRKSVEMTASQSGSVRTGFTVGQAVLTPAAAAGPDNREWFSAPDNNSLTTLRFRRGLAHPT